MSVTMLSAYCETSVARASANVAPRPATMTMTPTPSVRSAAAALPNTRSSNTKASGSDTSSARCRSRSSAASMSPFSGMFPVASTSNASVRTSARSCGKNPSASVVVPFTVTLASARFPSFDRSPGADAAATLSGVRTDAKRGLLGGDELADPVERERQDAVEVSTGERSALGGALHLDELALAGRDDVHVGIGDRVLGIRQIEEQVTPHIAGGDRGDVSHDGRGLDLAHRMRERDEAAGDRGRPRAAVGLDDLAVDYDAPRTERLQIDRRAKRAADKALDLEGPPARAPGDALALAPLGRAARKHRVLRGDPPGALALEEFRHTFLERRETQHLRVAEGDLGGAFGELRDPDVDGDRTKGRGRAAIRPRKGHAVSSHTRRISSGA